MFLIFLVSVVLAVPILILAMIITNSFGGGIEFGAFRMLLLKSLPLILIVQALSLSEVGSYLALVIWWLGLMIIFGLDFWEVRMLVCINWVLNFGLHFALVMTLK